ncbi:MAG TPA: hypothetical protein VHT97_10930 [Acidimicrobiales bacterium]|jgi:hypothetical protein|nr:hypothetical protein [Acidimicrobiales bacterium]
MIEPDLYTEPRPAPRQAEAHVAAEPGPEMLYELESGPEPVAEPDFPDVPEGPAPDHIEVVEVLSPSRRHLARAGRR